MSVDGTSIIILKDKPDINELLIKTLKISTNNIINGLKNLGECSNEECIKYAEEFINSLSTDIEYLASAYTMKDRNYETYIKALINTAKQLYSIFKFLIDRGLISSELPSYIDKLNPDEAEDYEELIKRVKMIFKLTPWVIRNVACKAYANGNLNENNSIALLLIGDYWDYLLRGRVSDALAFMVSSLLVLNNKYKEALELLQSHELATEDGLKIILKLCSLYVKLYEWGITL